jgi:hypothetical protein
MHKNIFTCSRADMKDSHIVTQVKSIRHVYIHLANILLPCHEIMPYTYTRYEGEDVTDDSAVGRQELVTY